MKLLELRLENFQGIKSEHFEFDGQSASIYGDNATGKTTVFNAVTWLLFDKSSTGAKNYTPKTNGLEGDLHYLDHAATGSFQMDDGRIVRLRKVFHEIWKKKRGMASEEFSGHGTDFFIDDVPVKEKDYTASLLAFCGGAEKMKMLTMPHYFSEDMQWDERRKILLEICGDVSDDEVIASSKDLRELPAFLLMPGTTNQHYTVEEYKKIAGAQKSDINKQLQDIPGRIDEARRAMPEIPVDVDAVKRQMDAIATERSQLAEQKASVIAGDTAASDIRTKISNATSRLAEARAAHITAENSVNEGTHAAIADIRKDLTLVQGNVAEIDAEIARRQRNVERMTSLRDGLLKDYETIQAMTWNESEAVCPTCNRSLPEEQVSDMREKFNLRKSTKLAGINERGQKEASKDAIMAEREEIATLNTKKSSAEQRVADLQMQLGTLQNQIKEHTPFETTEVYTTLSAEIASYRSEEAASGGAMSEALNNINAQIGAADERYRSLQNQKSQAEQAETQKKRIAELEHREKTLSGQYEELEKGIYLCDLFVKAKVAMLTERINAKFKNVRFRLFIEQQNGGVKDDCEVMIPASGGKMVPYTFANNAARINAGLEIIGALSEHWGISMPVFIDNAESVTSLARLNTQVVRLVVSAADSILRMELDQSNEGAA